MNTLTLPQINVVFVPEVETFFVTMVAKFKTRFLPLGLTVASQVKPALKKQKLDGVAAHQKYQIKITDCESVRLREKNLVISNQST